MQSTTEEILSTSKQTHRELEQLATTVEVKLNTLQAIFQNDKEDSRLVSVKNLKKTVISAATVISGGATDVANLDDFASDFGD